nr:unnamed protein product [Digitaria exilis]
MADSLFVVLRKVALSLGECVLERIGTELAEVAPILTDFEHSLKQIEGELSIMKAFIDQVGVQRDGDRAFDAWLDQVRDVAHEVEDIIDEHAYLTAQAPETSSFFKRKFHQIRNFASWQKLPAQISQVEARIQRLAEMRNRYGISVRELDKSNKLQQHNNQFSMSDFAYLADNSEIVGHTNEIARLTQWLLEEKQDRTLIAIFGMGGLGKTTITSSVYKDQKIRRAFDCRAWVTLSQTYHAEELLREIINQLIDQRSSMASGVMTMNRMRLVELTFRARWFPKLKSLQIVDMEHLNLIEIEDGTLMSLHILEFTGLRNLKAVPEGIKYIRTLDQMFLTDMSNEFTERLLGSDNHIVQHITDIRNFGSSDSPAANNFISSEYLVKKYGAGAIKNSPVE